MRRETASAYLKAAGIAVRGPRCRHAKPASEVITDSAKPVRGVVTDPAKPASEVITDSVPSRSLSSSACEPYREEIEAAVRAGRQAMSIWQDLVTERGFTAKYASVQRFVRQLRRASGEHLHPVIITPPGEESQVDYGDGPMVRHPETGKYRRTRMFSMVLGHSRKAVWLLTWKSSAKIWSKLHEQAFRRLGGATKVVVLDNLREGVLKPDVYDPVVNPLYRDVLAHYGVTALPCRVRDPNRKGKVESAVKHAQNKMRGLRFETIEAAQEYLDKWTQRWADTRIHGTTKQQVQSAFEEEKPHLTSLPTRPFRYYEYGSRSVNRDGTVEVCGSYYGVPPGRMHTRVHVQWDDLHVRILDPNTWELLREHTRAAAGRFRIHPDDRPKRTPKSTERLLEGADELGKHVGLLCREIHRLDGETPGVRRIQGVLRLANKYGYRELERACAFALESCCASYRFVKRYLEQLPSPDLTLRQVDPLIRELNEYKNLIEQRTKGQETS